MKHKLIKMLELQDAMNQKVNPAWRDAGYAWYRAIWTECAEMLDHYGWKWWKHQKPDMEQVELEMVDIWHFTLSDALLKHETIEQAADAIAQDIDQPRKSSDDLRALIESHALAVLGQQGADIPSFMAALDGCGMSFDDLYAKYIGKNVLNFFRQDHGYKQGTYQKIWHGREDNEVLTECLASLDHQSDQFAEQLYQSLSAAYPGS